MSPYIKQKHDNLYRTSFIHLHDQAKGYYITMMQRHNKQTGQNSGVWLLLYALHLFN